MAGIAEKNKRLRRFCRICRKPLDPHEVAREVGEDAFCSSCIESNGFMAILSRQHSRNYSQLAIKAKIKKKHHRKPWLLIICSVIIVLEVNMLIIFPPRTPRNRHLAAEGPRVEFVNKLDHCLENMWLFSDALEKYRNDNGKFPKTLDKLVPAYLDKVPTCPHSSEPYTYLRRGEYYLLECPNPQDHNIKSLMCDGRGAAPTIVTDEEE